MATFTFSNSLSTSGQSFEIPKFTFIFVDKPFPTPFAKRELCFLFAGIAISPFATLCIKSFSSIDSLLAILFISLVKIPFLAASI